MNNERYQQIIDEAYERFLNETIKIEPTEVKEKAITQLLNSKESKEEFINKIKTDSEFSEKWELKIEERELSEKERIVLSGYDYENRGGIGWNMLKDKVDMDNSIPRKLITVTYNDIKTEIYE